MNFFPRRTAAWLLALALLAAQTLGLLHRYAHAGGLATPTAASAVSPEARSWTQDLFAAHEGDPGCRLYDQLHASGLCADLPATVATPLPNFIAAWTPAPHVATAVRRLAARGPPALR